MRIEGGDYLQTAPNEVSGGAQRSPRETTANEIEEKDIHHDAENQLRVKSNNDYQMSPRFGQEKHENAHQSFQNRDDSESNQRPLSLDDRGSEEDELIVWRLDYGDQESYSGVESRTSVNLSGIHMMIINDRKNVFYPILQMNIEKF